MLKKDKLQKLMDDISNWHSTLFPQLNEGILNHLKEEIDELIEAHKAEMDHPYVPGSESNFVEHSELINKVKEEYADCFILLLNSAAIFQLSSDDIIEITRQKLEINKKRTWEEPDENGIIRHQKS